MKKSFEMTRFMRLGTAILRVLLRAGLPLGPLRLLSVRGRKSGRVYTTPVALLERDGTRWLVAAFGEVNRVHNIRAAGEAQLERGRRAEHIAVIEAESTEAAPVLKHFLAAFHSVPFIPPYFDATPDSPVSDFERQAAHHPVFRITRTKSG